ncbi:MAG: SulP family inorganic anion transporter [Candidatus Kerfeldbacteria bacterium]|nr:SulP family inorganic anion transporter [Candidatus Kerfeldbacteria bacterium]
MLKRVIENWRAGLTVALISIPLSISLAVASGARPEMGLITAVWAGLLSAFFSGSNYNIVGPAGALSAALAAFSISEGMDLLPTLAIVTGIFIFIAYLFKLERYLVLVPGSVMHGFSLGVGIIIGLGQLNFAFGLKNIPKHAEFLLNVKETFAHIGQIQFGTFAVFLAFLIGLFALVKLVPKIPGAILLTPFGILLGYLSESGKIGLHIETLNQKFPNTSISIFHIPQFHFSATIVSAALGIAFIAILETLVSAKIADVMTHTKFNRRKEMFGLSLANIASGLFGGLPSTGVFVRTGLNIRSGATHKTAAGINAVCIALISVFFFRFFKLIPMSVIAAILVFASIRMVEKKNLKEMWVSSRRDFWLALATTLTMVTVDTVVGIIVGSMLALLFFIEHLSKGQFEMTINKENKILERYYTEPKDCVMPGGDVAVYSMKGDLTYLNAEAHISRIERYENCYTTIVLRMRELTIVDLEGVHAFDDLIKHLKTDGKKIYVSSLSKRVVEMLEHSSAFKELKADNCVFEDTRLALQSIGFKREHLETQQ